MRKQKKPRLFFFATNGGERKYVKGRKQSVRRGGRLEEPGGRRREVGEDEDLRFSVEGVPL